MCLGGASGQARHNVAETYERLTMRGIDEERRHFLRNTLRIETKIDLKPDYYELLQVEYDCGDAKLIQKNMQHQLAAINKIPTTSPFARRHFDWLHALTKEISVAATTLTDPTRRAQYNQSMKAVDFDQWHTTEGCGEKTPDTWGELVYKELLLISEHQNGKLYPQNCTNLHQKGKRFNLEETEVDAIIREAEQKGKVKLASDGRDRPILRYGKLAAVVAGCLGLFLFLYYWLYPSNHERSIIGAHTVPGNFVEVKVKDGQAYCGQLRSKKDNILQVKEWGSGNLLAFPYSQIKEVDQWKPPQNNQYRSIKPGKRLVVLPKGSAAVVFGTVVANADSKIVIEDESGKEYSFPYDGIAKIHDYSQH